MISKKWFKEYYISNKHDILMVISLILIGIIIGGMLYIFSGSVVKDIAIAEVKEVFEISKAETYVKTNIVLNGIKADVILICVLFFFTLTLFGKYLIYFVMLLKGVALSIYTIILMNIFGPLWGSLVVFMLVILVNLIYLPALIYITVAFLGVNFNLFKARINSLNAGNITKVVLAVILSFMVMFSSVIVEQIVSSVVLNIYGKI